MPTQQELVYNRIAELTDQGNSLADAVRQVAIETGKTENAVRALRFNYKRKLEGGSRAQRGKPAPLTAAQAVSEAKKLLISALNAIDRELTEAKSELDAAQARYNSLATSASERKTELQRKIEALS